MNQHKYFVGVIAAMALIAAACGGSDDASSGGSGSEAKCAVDAHQDSSSVVDVTVWHGITGLAAKTVDELATAFNQTQDKVKVTVEPQGTYEEQLKKFTDSLRDPSTLPDVMLAEDTNTQFMIDSGAAIPAAACIEADPDAGATYDDLIPAVDSGYTVEGTLWPAAFGVSTPVIYYNQAHFATAGLDPAVAPGSLAEIRTDAEALRAANPDPAYSPLVFRTDAWWLEHLDTRADAALVNEDNGRKALGTSSELLNEETQIFVDWLVEMKNEGLMKAVAYSATFDAYLSVATQSASMLVETSTASTTVDALITGSLNAEDVGLEDDADLSGLSFPDLEIGVGELPGPDGPGSGQVGGNAWYMVNTGVDERVSAAWEFIKYFNDTANQVTWTERGSYLPVFTRVQEDSGLQAYFTDTRPGQWLAIALESLQAVDPDFPGPVIGPYKEFRTEVRGAFEEFLIGGADPDSTMDTANSNFQSALDEYAKDVGVG